MLAFGKAPGSGSECALRFDDMEDYNEHGVCRTEKKRRIVKG